MNPLSWIKNLVRSDQPRQVASNKKSPTLADLFDELPADLSSYFDLISDGSFSGRQDLELNLLGSGDAARWTQEFRGFQTIVEMLDGVILDDANTSNHHVYLAKEPCSRSILYLSHDGPTRIVFSSLSSFLDSARKSIESDQSLTSFHPDPSALLANQLELKQLIADLYDEKYDCDGTEIILALIPSWDLSDFALLERLAVSKDFFISQAVGDAITSRPRAELASIARICQQQSHPQAAKAGARAVAAVEKVS